MEIDVNEHEFKFYGSPYFLRLSFPGKVHEDGTEKASYDISSGLLTIRLPKVDQDQHFPDLDMLTTLLAAPPPPPVAISSSSSSSSLSSSNDLLMEESFSSSLPEGGSISSLLNIQNDTPDSSSSTPCTTNPTRPLIQVLEPPACSAETLNEQQHQKTINQDNNPDMHGGVMDENQHEESVGDEMIDWYAEQDVPTAVKKRSSLWFL